MIQFVKDEKALHNKKDILNSNNIKRNNLVRSDDRRVVVV